MRRIDYLIKDARLSTNTQDTEAITSYLCLHFLNKAQSFIQSAIFTQNNEAKIFRGEVIFNTVSGIDSYQLPFDVYAKNSINNVAYVVDNGSTRYYSRIQAISEKNRGGVNGYFTSEGKIIFSPIPQNSQKISISYNKKAPSVAKRYGKIVTVNTNSSIVLDVGYGVDDYFYGSGFEFLDKIDDFYSIVDKDGKIIKCGIEVNQTLGTLLISDTTDVLVGHYVVPGKYATTHCRLPDECEDAMISALQKFIVARMSSTDLPMEKMFSDEFIQSVSALFAENDGDAMTPPVTEYSEWF